MDKVKPFVISRDYFPKNIAPFPSLCVRSDPAFAALVL